MSKEYIYPAIFHPEEEGGFSVTVPDLDGCFSGGDTLEEALHMAWDACAGWINLAIKSGERIPRASSINDMHVSGDDFATYIVVDLDDWKKKVNNAVVRRTVSLPAWLNEMAQERRVNCSKLLQEALLRRFDVNI